MADIRLLDLLHHERAVGRLHQTAICDGICSHVLPSSSEVRFTDDPEVVLLGRLSLRANVQPYGGGRVMLRCTLPGGAESLEGKSQFVFWLKTRNEHVPAWQDVNPLVAIVGPDGARTQLTPARDFLSSPPYIEAREGWTHSAVPLAGSEEWQRSGAAIGAATMIELGFDSWGAPPLVIWVDGLGVK